MPRLTPIPSIRKLLFPTSFLCCLVLSLTCASASAEDWMWHRRAIGQAYLTCPSGDGPITYYWPKNNFWSQSEHYSFGCDNSTTVMSEPSNWEPSSAVYPNSATANVVLGDAVELDVPVQVHSLSLQSNGTLNMRFGTSIKADVYDLRTDSGVTVGGGGGAWPILTLDGGTLLKSAGSGLFSFDPGVSIHASRFTVTSESGGLVLPGNSSEYNGGTFSAATGAVIELVPTNEVVRFGGVIQGGGAGTIQLSHGRLGVLEAGTSIRFSGEQFQWKGGTIEAGQNAFVNSGVVNVSGDGVCALAGSLLNSSNFVQKGTALLNLPFGSTFNNDSGSTYDLQSDTGIIVAGGGGYAPVFNNAGVFRKSAGEGTASIQSLFNNIGGEVDVRAGTLALEGGGTSSNATYVVDAGAFLEIGSSNAETVVSGLLIGSGQGKVRLSQGTLRTGAGGAIFDFPSGLFEWGSGKIGGSLNDRLTNAGAIQVAGSGWKSVAGMLFSRGTIRQAGDASLNIPFGAAVWNLPGGIYELLGDSQITGLEGGGGAPEFRNYGVFRKAQGTGVATLTPDFNLYSGVIEVDSGTLALAGGGTRVQGRFIVETNATLDLIAGEATPMFAGRFTGEGAGTVLLKQGTLRAREDGLIWDMHGSLFQWVGGALAGNFQGGGFTNAGTITHSGTNAVGVSGLVNNSGLIVQGSSAPLNLPFGCRINNLSSGTFQLESGDITGQGGGGAGPIFYNTGLVRKTGSGLITVDSSVGFQNDGTVALEGGVLKLWGDCTQTSGRTILGGGSVDVGQTFKLQGGELSGSGSVGGLVVNTGGTVRPSSGSGLLEISGNYSQYGTGTLAIELGGREPTDNGQLKVNGNASLGARLVVSLKGTFRPMTGDQFQLISANQIGGAFASVVMPPGLSLAYSNTGVFLTVTGAVPVQVASVRAVGTNMGFSFGTFPSREYVIEVNTNLANPYWAPFQTVTGDGTSVEVLAPIVSGVPGRYFRVREE